MKLTLDHIQKSFGDKDVLKDISFSAESGKAFGLLGRNGAGKTTTIRILMNVFAANAGTVTLDGRPIDYDHVSFGYLPEERGLYPKKAIIDQLVYLAQLKGMTKRNAVRSVDWWLGRLDMSQYRSKRLDTLSKGNQQKIQLITALAHDPQIVILDEPFSGLDPVNAMLLEDVVKEEIGKGKLVIFSSHQMSYIEEFCDSIAIINQGRIAITGELAQIKHHYVRDKLVVKTNDAQPILTEYGSSCSRTDQGSLIIKMPSPNDKQAVMRHLTETYDIDQISVFEPSLNDIFVKYAGDSK